MRQVFISPFHRAELHRGSIQIKGYSSKWTMNSVRQLILWSADTNTEAGECRGANMG